MNVVIRASANAKQKYKSAVALGAALIICLPLGSQGARAADLPIVNLTSQTPAFDAAGIPLVASVKQARPTSERQAQELSDAQVFVEQHPDDVGYPWIAPETGVLELSAASVAGRQMLDIERLARVPKARLRDVVFSYGQLQRIMDEITTLNEAGVPDAGLIYGTSRDHGSNRVVVWVSKFSDRLFQELAGRYGTEAIAILIDGESFGGSTLSRSADASPYYGGASINAAACSDAFSWYISGAADDAMLTAAHCMASGGNVTIDQIIGTVTATTEENWSNTYGTRYYGTQSVYRGDVAVIRIKDALASSPRIYRGGVNSFSSSPVISRLARYSQTGDKVLIGGRASGETGPYEVTEAGANWLYSSDGPNVWARNIVKTTIWNAGDPCVKPGDSGGSVFHFPVSTSGVQAVGTQSGYWNVLCNPIFTDIYNSYLGLPGDIMLP